MLDEMLEWLYGQIVGFLGNFFAQMGAMGTEIFDTPWVQSIVLFFSYLGWSLYGTGLVVSAFECGISLIMMGYAVFKVFFSNLKRGGILLIQICVGSLHMFSVSELQLCRGALYESVFTAANVSIYDHTLYGGEALSTYENILLIAAELQLCDSTADPMEIVTRGEAAQLLHAALTQELIIEAPTAPVRMENLTGVNANDFLIELKKVPEPILAAFNKHSWTYCIDFRA